MKNNNALFLRLVFVAVFLFGSGYLFGQNNLLPGEVERLAVRDTIKDIMKKSHRGKPSLLKKVLAGDASVSEKSKLMQYYRNLSLKKPPGGDIDSWNKKTAALVNAATDALNNKEGSLAALKEASNCKACHSVHKKKKK